MYIEKCVLPIVKQELQDHTSQNIALVLLHSQRVFHAQFEPPTLPKTYFTLSNPGT